MILLDTNVISEPLRREPEPRVVNWIDAQVLDTLYLSAITVAELRAGIALLPTGKRRTSLLENLERQVLPLFDGRVLSFDLACTQAYAGLIAKTQRPEFTIPAARSLIPAGAAATNGVVPNQKITPFN